MRPRHTRRTDQSLNGPSTQRSLRLPEAQVKLVQSAIEAGIPEIHTLTDAATDALWLWLYEAKAVEMVVQGVRQVGTGLQPSLAVDGGEPATTHLPPASPPRPKFSDVDLDALDEDDDAV